ncbi:MAG: GMC family oxidoreductase N-terminal domain-containing protein [Pirellula sp.]|nr:GMC family oxidoreductase N-terminal domain-containing protein [Pirellula sp.]
MEPHYPPKLDRRTWLSGAAGLATAATAARKSNGDLSLASAPAILSRRRSADSTLKKAAREDYSNSLKPFGGKLRTDPQTLYNLPPNGKPYQFDVLIVGSGYGASITAARLSARMRPGTRIAILERGKEWTPGDFPDTLPDVMAQSRLKLFGKHQREVDNPTGLFQVLQCDEIAVLSGSGLGGSSLINANVAIRPDADVFLQPQWPTALRDFDYLAPYYDQAAMELGVCREPIDWTYKMRAQRLAVERLRDSGLHFEAAALTILRQNGSSSLPVLNRHGMLQRGCIDCGDCLTGCNVGAKNTLAMNYLPIARRNQTMLFTQMEVRQIERSGEYWRVHYLQHDCDSKGEASVQPGSVTCRILVLGAGSIGSSEILMRSANACLDFSKTLGRNWTGNGDALGFIRKTECPTHVAGSSALPTDAIRVGPTIQSNVTTPHVANLLERTLVQEGVAARSYANALSLLMLDLDLDHTQILLGMGHDGQQGRLVLEPNGNAKVEWPGLLDSPYRQRIRAQFSRLAEGHQGQYRYLRIFGDKMISVHPLGGCGMSDDPRYGVTNHKGQVYDLIAGGDIDDRTGEYRIHEGLYVCDGAILPTAIACNPFMTISALAERSAQLIALEPKYSDLFRL